jgi:hypothetical protein
VNNWELKAIAVLILIGVIAVVVHFATGGSGEVDAGLITSIILMSLGAITSFLSGFVLLISAFDQDVTTGLLFLFLPFYSYYFALSLYDGNNKGALVGTYLLGNLILFIGVTIFWL